MSTTNEKSKSLRRSEILGLFIAGFGQNLIFGFWGGYMMKFHTDILGITAAAAGLIALLTRILDAVNDSMSGMIVDQTKTKWGRYRPWFLFASLPIAVIFVLCFTTPNLNMGLKIAYAAVTYVLMSIFFDFVDVPFWSIPAAMTVDANKRGSIFVFSRIATTIGSLIIGIIAVPMIKGFGGTDEANSKGYLITSIVIAAVAAICYITGFFLVREHVEPAKQEKFKLSTIVNTIIKNRPLLFIIASFIFVNTATQIRIAMNLYFVETNLGNLDYASIISLVTVPGILIGMIFTPLLMKFFDKKKIYFWTCIAGAVLHVAYYFIGYSNVGLVLLFNALLTIPIGIASILVSTLISMTVEYSELKTGQRNEGLISSTQTFTSKLSIAIASGVTALSLIIGNYAVGQVTPLVTSTFMITVSLIPAVLLAIGAIPVLFFELTTKRHKEIVEELEQRKKVITEISE